DALDAAVEADKAAVENARVQLIYCSIDSPINGRVGSLLIHQGNMIKANDVPLVNINQIQPIRVAFTVPEQYLAEIKRFAANGKQGQYVCVVKPEMTVETGPVAVNRTTKGQSVIDKGLGPGERVVTDGQLRLVPGSRVQIKEAVAPQPGPTNGEYKNSPSAQVIRTQEARS